VHVKALVVVGVAHVSNVQKPYVSHIEDLIVRVGEELFEVGCWLNEVTKPDHSWQIMSSTLKESTSELDLLVLVSESSL